MLETEKPPIQLSGIALETYYRIVEFYNLDQQNNNGNNRVMNLLSLSLWPSNPLLKFPPYSETLI